MITDYFSEKELALYGIMNNFTGYTIDQDNLLVSVNVQMAYNINGIDSEISSLEQEIENLEADEELNSEYKILKLENLRDVVEIKKVLKEKLNG
jgi:hypothetical protein